jgi:hypothetical protein
MAKARDFGPTGGNGSTNGHGPTGTNGTGVVGAVPTAPRVYCLGRKVNGEPCETPVRSGKVYCFHHDPDSAVERRAARVRGGRASRRQVAFLPEDFPNFTLKDMNDVADALATLFNKVAKGQLDHRVANTAGYLASLLVNVMRPNAAEQMLLDLDKKIEERKAQAARDMEEYRRMFEADREAWAQPEPETPPPNYDEIIQTPPDEETF